MLLAGLWLDVGESRETSPDDRFGQLGIGVYGIIDLVKSLEEVEWRGRQTLPVYLW